MDIILENYVCIYEHKYDTNILNKNVNLNNLVIMTDNEVRRRFSNNVMNGIYILSRDDLNNFDNYNINNIDYLKLNNNIFSYFYEYTKTYIYPLLIKKTINEIIDMNLTEYEQELFSPLFTILDESSNIQFISIIEGENDEMSETIKLTIYIQKNILANLQELQENILYNRYRRTLSSIPGLIFLKMTEKYNFKNFKKLLQNTERIVHKNLDRKEINDEKLKIKLLNHQKNDILEINDLIELYNNHSYNINNNKLELILNDYNNINIDNKEYILRNNRIDLKEYINNNINNDINNDMFIKINLDIYGCLITSETGTGKTLPLLFKCFENESIYKEYYTEKDTCNYVYKKGKFKGENCQKNKTNKKKYCKEHEDNLFYDKMPINIIKRPINFYDNNKKIIKTEASLILCPSHLIEQWYNEYLKFFENYNKNIIVVGTTYQLNNLTIKDFLFADLIILSFNLYLQIHKYIRREYINENEIDLNENCKTLDLFEWKYIIIDEGQEFIKLDSKDNINYIKRLNKKFVFVLSATPYENNFYSYIKLLSIITNIIEEFKDDVNIFNENFERSLIVNFFYKRKCNILNVDFKELYYKLINNKIIYHNSYDFINRINNKDNIKVNKTIIKCEFTETEKSVYNSYKNSIRKINEILLKICCDYTLLNLKIFNDKSITLENLKETLVEYYENNVKILNEKINNTDSENQKKRLENKLNEYTNIKNYLSKTINEIKDNKGIQCPICFDEEIKQFSIFKCGHNFCKDCTQSLLKMKELKCPCCKIHVDTIDIKMIDLDLIYINNNNNETELNKIINDCNSTKIGNIIYYLKNNDERVLIFSQWDRLLLKLKDNMIKHGLKYVDLNGSIYNKTRNLNNFKENNAQILLMNSLFFNSGLNLQFCKKIIFIEPLYGDNIYKEAVKNQILGRINRIGQENCIEIITFIIKDTLEEELI